MTGRADSETAQVDPTKRFRPFRVAAYTLYIAVIGFFVVMVTRSVLRSVETMSPPPRAYAEVEPVSSCRARADGLWHELDRQRQAFSAEPQAREAGQHWSEFRVGWLERFREAEAHCSRPTDAEPQVKKLFVELERVQLLYATHANQYAAEVGGAVDRFRQTLNAL